MPKSLMSLDLGGSLTGVCLRGNRSKSRPIARNRRYFIGDRPVGKRAKPLLLDAEPAHEAVPELRGVALGGGGRGLVVDARGDEGGTVLGERARGKLLEARLV